MCCFFQSWLQWRAAQGNMTNISKSFLLLLLLSPLYFFILLIFSSLLPTAQWTGGIQACPQAHHSCPSSTYTIAQAYNIRALIVSSQSTPVALTAPASSSFDPFRQTRRPLAKWDNHYSRSKRLWRVIIVEDSVTSSLLGITRLNARVKMSELLHIVDQMMVNVQEGEPVHLTDVAPWSVSVSVSWHKQKKSAKGIALCSNRFTRRDTPCDCQISCRRRLAHI